MRYEGERRGRVDRTHFHVPILHMARTTACGRHDKVGKGRKEGGRGGYATHAHWRVTLTFDLTLPNYFP